MKSGLHYLKYSLLPVCIVITVFFFYVKAFCYFSTTSSDADLVCSMNWKDGLFLVSGYTVVKLLSPVIGLTRMRTRLFATFILYSISFGIVALPYWLTSLGQPLERNTFLHFFFIIFLVEGLFEFYL